MSDDHMARVDALRATLTTPEAIAAFAADIDDRVRALRYALCALDGAPVERITRDLDDARRGVGAALRACGVVRDDGGAT